MRDVDRQAAHTKGPWTIEQRPCTVNAKGEEVTRVCGEGIILAELKAYLQEERGMVAANARLIAAAPCMAQALKSLAAAVGPDYCKAGYEAAQAALRKAGAL